MSKKTYKEAISASRNKATKISTKDINAKLTRTVKLYHGTLKNSESIDEDGNTVLKKYPTEGIRIINISPACNATDSEIAANYNGNLYNATIMSRTIKKDNTPKEEIGKNRPRKRYNAEEFINRSKR